MYEGGREKGEKLYWPASKSPVKRLIYSWASLFLSLSSTLSPASPSNCRRNLELMFTSPETYKDSCQHKCPIDSPEKGASCKQGCGRFANPC